MSTEMRKVFVVGGDMSTTNLFTTRGWANVSNVSSADLVCFTGGADVSPDLYDHPKHYTTWSDPSRDAREMAIFEAASGKGTPMVGICRGGQFLNVMNGGKMYQDVSGHTMSHKMKIGNPEVPDDIILVTSTHHQMMMPAIGAKLLAVGSPSTVNYWDDEKECWEEKMLSHGIEVLQYGKSLCFQPHPEMRMDSAEFDPMRKYFFACINSLMAV